MGRKAPWSEKELEGLRAWQQSPLAHAMTCPQHSEQKLQVSAEALSCPQPGCDYRQEWVPTGTTGDNALSFLTQQSRMLGNLLNRQEPT